MIKHHPHDRGERRHLKEIAVDKFAKADVASKRAQREALKAKEFEDALREQLLEEEAAANIRDQNDLHVAREPH